MTTKQKIKTIISGIIIPFFIFVAITFLVVLVSSIITNPEDLNSVFIQAIADIFVILILLPMYIQFKKNNGLDSKLYFSSELLYIIPISISVCIIGNLLVKFIPYTSENIVTEEVYKLTEKYNVIVSLICVGVLIPIVEEIIFRGFFYDTVKIISSDVIAIIFTSISFALAHIDLKQCVYAFFAGLFIGYIKYKFKSILYTIIMHLIMNVVALIFVPTIFQNDDNKYVILNLFIMSSILFFSMYRLNLKKRIV